MKKVLGGVLIHVRVSGVLLHFDLPLIDTPIDTPAEAAISLIVGVYAVAALFNLKVPATGVTLKRLPAHPWSTVKDFSRCVAHLWKDRLGQISLAVTTLFWGAGATLQFILIDWAAKALGFNLSQASMLQGVVAAGIAAGAVIAARYVSLRGAVKLCFQPAEEIGGGFVEEPQPTRAADFLFVTLDRTELDARRAHRVRLDLESRSWLNGSEDELRSAFGNLVSNAVRYTPEGGRITIGWNSRGSEAVFWVQDTGIGIEPEHIPRLTERFYRVDRSRSRSTGGTGLGLAIVKHVLHRHQARLEVASEPGKGSTFSVVFPEARVLATPPEKTASPANAPAESDSEPVAQRRFEVG